MGTICISSYVNIFMPGFEEKYIYPLIKNKSVIYFQYIDNKTIYEQNKSKTCQSNLTWSFQKKT